MGRIIRKAGACLLAALILFLLGLGFFESRSVPVLCKLAQAQAGNAASRMIGDVIGDTIEDESLGYGKIILFEKDVDGRITALRTNMQQVNRLKARILTAVNEKLLSVPGPEIGIPLGNLIFPEFFGGMGPVIPVKILAIRSCHADFLSDFTQAGINQTLHRLHMTVRVEGTILVLGNVLSFSASSDVSVAETVIVGDVPNSYS